MTLPRSSSLSLFALFANLLAGVALAAPAPSVFENIRLTAPPVQGTPASVSKVLALTSTGVGETLTPIKLWQAVVLTGDVDKSDVGLGNVENTALSTWTGSANLTTLGTITAGTWSGTIGAVSGESITNLNASNLSSGTVPDARFPATLPAASGVNLTGLNAASLAAGEIPAARMPAFTGDVTTTAGTVATTISAGAVTLPKMANIATGSLIYRKTAGAGVPEVNTLATLKTDLGLIGTNSGDQTTIAGISGTTAQFNTALSDADFATGGGTATGINTGDQTSVTGNAGTADVASVAVALQTARNINGVGFNGTANITVPASANTLTGTALPALDGSALTGLTKTQVGLANVENTALSTWPGSANLTTGAGGLFGTGAYATIADYLPLAGGAATGVVTSLNVKRGAGSPEGVTTGAIGDIYQRTDGTTNSSLYRKEAGAGNTGWVAVSNAGGGGGGDMLAANNLSDVVNPATARTNLGATTVGGNLFTLPNPGAVSFPKINAANTVTARSATDYRTDLGLVIGTDVVAPGGNVATATALQTARTINGVSFDGTANITAPAAAETLTGTALPALSGASVTALNATQLTTGTVPGARMPALTGDVTTIAGAVATTIANSAVTLPKMADVGTGTVFYRKTALAGAPETQTLATLKTDLGLSNNNSGDQTTIVGITGTLAEFNTALTGADFATGGGTATGTNTGDQTISDATITTTDITTNNFTTLKHGFVPKGTNVGNFLRDDGTFAAPSGGGDMLLAGVQSVTGLKTYDTTKWAMKGSAAGVTTIASANASATNYTATLKAETGTIAYLSDITASALTATQVGYGSAGNALTGEAPFNYTAGTDTLVVPNLTTSGAATLGGGATFGSKSHLSQRLTNADAVIGTNFLADPAVAGRINRVAAGGANGMLFHTDGGIFGFAKAGPGTAGELLASEADNTNQLFRFAPGGFKAFGPWNGDTDARFTVDAGGSIRAYTQKPDLANNDLNFEGGVLVSHAKNYGGTPGYANTTQAYALGGSSGMVVGSNNFTGATVPYVPSTSSEPNGYVRIELGPIWPNSEKLRFNYSGEVLIGMTLVRNITSAAQAGTTTVTAAGGAFTAADVGRYIAWSDYTNGGIESHTDKITVIQNSTTITVSRSRTITAQACRIVTFNHVLRGADGTATFAGNITTAANVTAVAGAFTGNVTTSAGYISGNTIQGNTPGSGSGVFNDGNGYWALRTPTGTSPGVAIDAWNGTAMAQALLISSAGGATFSGSVTQPGVTISAATAMAALAINVTKSVNSKSIAADSTFTFSATPASGTTFSLMLTGDATARTVTIPSSYSLARSATITSFTLPASTVAYLTWFYDGAVYRLVGEPVSINDLTADATPDSAADYVETYDASAATHKKVLIQDLPLSVATKQQTAAYTVGTTDANEPWGGVIYASNTGVISLPVIAVGMSVTVIADAAVVVTVDPNASQQIRLEGTTLAAGFAVKSAAAIGEVAVFTYYGAGVWFCSSATFITNGS